MNRLTITNVEAKDNVLRVHFKCDGQIRKFFEKNVFFVEYDTSIEDVPEAFLVIPCLATVCSIAWAGGADVYVKTVDENFLHALGVVKKTFQKFYPEVGFGGSIHADNIVTPDVGVRSKSMMLFSGGADSLTTYIRHRTENPVLVCVHGADVELTNREAWNTVMETSQEFADQTGSKLRTIQSNFRSILHELMIATYYENCISHSWWGGVMHGLSLLGLCAPLTYIDKIGKLYIASTYTKEFPEPWGSHPDIDNNVKWTGTTVLHDGYELSRQEKLNAIAEYIKASGHKFVIRACWESEKNANCSICEKCSRTILGLELAGIDPNEYGYEVNANTFSAMKKKIENGEWYNREGVRFMWEDIQHHALSDQDLPHSEAKELIDWLVTVDLGALKTKPEKSTFPNYHVLYRKYLPYSLYKVGRNIATKIHS
ncbi:hypothetical protein D4R86_03165 [bacterium]|nr:MAG: hypothetical protein D4R86_03165 [bacterium]